jgi:hypothetical protein
LVVAAALAILVIMVQTAVEEAQVLAVFLFTTATPQLILS